MLQPAEESSVLALLCRVPNSHKQSCDSNKKEHQGFKIAKKKEKKRKEKA